MIQKACLLSMSEGELRVKAVLQMMAVVLGKSFPATYSELFEVYASHVLALLSPPRGVQGNESSTDSNLGHFVPGNRVDLLFFSV